MKHIIALLCALILISSVCAVICAADEIYTEGTLYYTIGDETVTIVGCFGRKTEVTVPSSIAGYPVNTIATGAFTTNKYIKKLNLPDTITAIGKDAIADGIHVIYNANTDHPQEEIPDIITGREPILVPADTDETRSKQSDDHGSASASTENSVKRNTAGDVVIEDDVIDEDSTDGGGASSSGSSSGSSGTKSGSGSGSDSASNSSKSASTESGASEASANAEKSASNNSSSNAALTDETSSSKSSSGDTSTPDETGSGNSWLIIILIIVGAASAVVVVFFFIRKERNNIKQ